MKLMDSFVNKTPDNGTPIPFILLAGTGVPASG